DVPAGHREGVHTFRVDDVEGVADPGVDPGGDGTTELVDVVLDCGILYDRQLLIDLRSVLGAELRLLRRGDRAGRRAAPQQERPARGHCGSGASGEARESQHKSHPGKTLV